MRSETQPGVTEQNKKGRGRWVFALRPDVSFSELAQQAVDAPHPGTVPKIPLSVYRRGKSKYISIFICGATPYKIFGKQTADKHQVSIMAGISQASFLGDGAIERWSE